MALEKECKGFICGSHLINGSVTIDKIDKESFTEYIKDIIESSVTENWFQQAICDALNNSADSDCIESFFKKLFKLFVKEEWFKDLICSLGCTAPVEIFDVIPTDITFTKEGGESEVQIIVADGAEWELTL